MYQTVEKMDIEYLKSNLTCPVLVGEDISEDYTHDEMGTAFRMPGVVVKANTIEDVSVVMAYATQRKIPVTVRGAGTGLSGGCTPLTDAIVLETIAMNKILELDEDNLTVTVEAGVLLKNLTDFVESKGYFYPPDPGEKFATLGGNISTNAGGMRAVKYGTTNSFVRTLTVVLPTGEIVELGANVAKNSSGFDLKSLVVGSEGLLAVVVRATLRLLPLPTASTSLLVPYASMEDALGCVPKIIRAKFLPTALEYMGSDIVGMIERYMERKFADGVDADSYLLMTFDGNDEDQVNAEIEKVAELCLENGALDAYLLDTPQRKKSVWDARGNSLEAMKNETKEMEECDIVVPRSRVMDFIKFTKDIEEELGVRICCIGHAGDGNVHVNLLRDDMGDEAWENAIQRTFSRLFPVAAEMGGAISGEHGIGWSKRGVFREQMGPDRVRLLEGIKATFDPANILNPDKVFAKD